MQALKALVSRLLQEQHDALGDAEEASQLLISQQYVLSNWVDLVIVMLGENLQGGEPQAPCNCKPSRSCSSGLLGQDC